MPSTKEPATSRRQPRAPKPKAPAQAAPKADAVSSEAMFDGPPAEPSEQQGATPPAVTKIDPPAASAPASPTVIDQPSTEPQVVTLGQTTGLLQVMTLAEVQDALKPFAQGIAALRASPEILPLLERMRATEGRCAPLYFGRSEDGKKLYLMHGVDAAACAQQLGLERVFVVTVAAEDAEAAHQHLATQALQEPSDADDDLVLRVHAHYDG